MSTKIYIEVVNNNDCYIHLRSITIMNSVSIYKIIMFFLIYNNFTQKLGTLLHFARQRSEGGAYRQTRVEAQFSVNSRAAKSTHASVTQCVNSAVNYGVEINDPSDVKKCCFLEIVHCDLIDVTMRKFAIV